MWIKDRLKLFIEKENISKSRFERSVGLSNGYISNIKCKIGVDKLERILKQYPQINRDWLFFGTGNMYNSTSQTETKNSLLKADSALKIKDKNNDLKAFFREKGITQQEIAKRLNKSQAFIHALLNGKPFGKRTAIEWSEAFGLSPMWLMTGEGDMILDGNHLNAKNVQISQQNTVVQTEPERLLTLLERKEEQIQQRDRQIDELIGLLKQQMNK